MLKNEDIEMLNLSDFSKTELKEMENRKVEFSKVFGKLIGDSRKDSKLENCYYCGEKASSFCNSHSIPAFCLRNIATDGKVLYSNAFIDLPLLSTDKGVNEAGTFKIICRDCDGKIFSDYENPDKYTSLPTPRMLAQIAMKNYLKSISKRLLEVSLYENIKSELGIPEYFYQNIKTVHQLDLNEYVKGFKYAKKINEKNWSDAYYLCFYEKLDYVVPVAFQSNITLLVDFEGNIINDSYNFNSNYSTQDIHICIFPHKASSIIMMFVDSEHKRYRKFYRQFNKMSASDRLAAINYIAIMYSEDVFFSPLIDESVLNHPLLKELSGKSLIAASSTPIFDPLENAKESFDFSKMLGIPNLLSKEFEVL